MFTRQHFVCDSAIEKWKILKIAAVVLLFWKSTPLALRMNEDGARILAPRNRTRLKIEAIVLSRIIAKTGKIYCFVIALLQTTLAWLKTWRKRTVSLLLDPRSLCAYIFLQEPRHAMFFLRRWLLRLAIFSSAIFSVRFAEINLQKCIVSVAGWEKTHSTRSRLYFADDRQTFDASVPSLSQFAFLKMVAFLTFEWKLFLVGATRATTMLRLLLKFLTA